MPVHNLTKRALTGVLAQSSSPSSTSNLSHNSVGSTTVLVPLVLSIILVGVAIGLGVFCFVGHRRRQRVWWRNFDRRRGLIEKEDLVEDGPGMWEVEVRDEVRDLNVDVDDWSERPVAVTYRHKFHPTSSSFHTDSKPTSSSSSATSIALPPFTNEVEPNQVEMTFLIAMPSPISTPTRSRRTSPSSSLPNLSEVSMSDLSSNRKGDEIPAIELATVIIPLERAAD